MFFSRTIACYDASAQEFINSIQGYEELYYKLYIEYSEERLELKINTRESCSLTNNEMRLVEKCIGEIITLDEPDHKTDP